MVDIIIIIFTVIVKNIPITLDGFMKRIGDTPASLV